MQQHVFVLARKSLLGLAAKLAFLPPVERIDRGDDDDAKRHQAILQVAHTEAYAASSASFIASSMSTATTRDTPASCMVIPISWLAISIVILLWLMNRNCELAIP